MLGLALVVPLLSAQAAQTGGPMPQAVVTDGTPAVGALFSLGAKGALGAHFCTGSVVDSPAGDVVVTAAHCVTGRSPGGIAFVPGYVDGEEPYGVFDVEKILVDRAWAVNASTDDDVAFLVVGGSGGASGGGGAGGGGAGGGGAGAPSLESVTGGEHLGIDQSAGRLVQVIGYPDGADAPISCQNTVRSFSATQLEFDCGGYTVGTSGGPILVPDAAGGEPTVIGVIGGYEQGGNTPQVSYAAKFARNVAQLYQKAIAPSASASASAAPPV